MSQISHVKSRECDNHFPIFLSTCNYNVISKLTQTLHEKQYANKGNILTAVWHNGTQNSTTSDASGVSCHPSQCQKPQTTAETTRKDANHLYSKDVWYAYLLMVAPVHILSSDSNIRTCKPSALKHIHSIHNATTFLAAPPPSHRSHDLWSDLGTM
jgi:hypothetical protein